MFATFVGIYNVQITASLIDSIISTDRELVRTNILIIIFIFLLTIVINYCCVCQKNKIEKEIRISIKNDVFRVMTRTSEKTWRKKEVSVGKILNIFREDTNVFTTVLFYIIDGVQVILYVVLVGIALCRINSIMVLAISILLPGSLFITVKLTKKIKDLHLRILILTDELWCFMSEVSNSLCEIRSNGGSGTLEKIVNLKMNDIKQYSIQNEKKKYVLNSIVSFTGFVNYIFVIIYGGNLVWENQITMGQLTACFLLARMYLDKITTLINLHNSIKQQINCIDRLWDIYKLNQEDEANETDLFGQAIVDSISINSLSIKKGTRLLFENLNAFFKIGTPYYIKGANGTGKTSLLNAIAGNEVDTSGKIQFAERELVALSNKDREKMLAFLCHEPVVYSISVAENLSIYNTEPVSEEEILNVIKTVGLFDDILAFKEGIYTVLNKEVKLSAGQRQKLALGRILLKNAQVYLLDEPMTNLDVESQNKIVGILQQLAEDKLVLVVTHDDMSSNENNTLYLDTARYEERRTYDNIK